MKGARIAEELERLGLDGWSLLFQEQEKSALHLTRGGAVETGIDAVRRQAEVTVFKRSGAHLGDARFTLFTDDADEIGRRVGEALVIAGESMKPGWPLPKRQRYGRVATADPRIAKAFDEGKAAGLLLRTWKAMRAAAEKERGVVVNHAELHLTRTKSAVMNSAGLRGKGEATALFVEAIAMARGRGREAEFHDAVTVGALAGFSATGFIKRTASSARDVLQARKWRRVHDEGIVLTGAALRDFWAPELGLSPVVAHANAQAKHRKLSRFERGKRVTSNRGFTLRSDPFVPFNPASGRFDMEGTASRRLSLVEKGVCAGLLANQRYAHYLGVPPTGALGVVTLASGASRAGELLEGAVEIVSFSSFVPNSLSGDFSAEIRLGYLQEAGKKVPIRGAMFTGNVFAMLDAMRASREGCEMERYKGPAAVRFDAGCHLAGF